MAKHEITVPEVGESVTEGFIVEWHVSDGEYVDAEAELFELETDKITMTVQAEVAGVVSVDVPAEKEVEVGQVVGTIDTEAEAEAGDGGGEGGGTGEEEPEEKAEEKAGEKAGEQAGAADEETDEESGGGEEEAAGGDLEDLAPSVRRLVAENDLDPDEIEGTGKGGRLTKEDVVRHMREQQRAERKEETRQAPAARGQKEKKSGEEPEEGKKGEKAPPPPPPPRKREQEGDEERQTRKPMSQIRKRIAQRLLDAKHSTAMLTTFNEVDMSNLMAMRERYKKPFEERYGIKLGIMSFFIKAAVDALQTHPEVNRMIEGDDLIENHYYDIGVAVSTERGLMVPVVRDADQLSYADLELTLADLAKRAREGKIGLDELQGGVFSITNGGIFGSMLSTPILNPPQAAILGMHGIKKRPVVVENEEGGDELVIRPMMYLALSYDHRVIDGRESVTFLRRIMDCIENPERMMFEI